MRQKWRQNWKQSRRFSSPLGRDCAQVSQLPLCKGGRTGTKGSFSRRTLMSVGRPPTTQSSEAN